MEELGMEELELEESGMEELEELDIMSKLSVPDSPHNVAA
jgi:hypothetical protein